LCGVSVGGAGLTMMVAAAFAAIYAALLAGSWASRLAAISFSTGPVVAPSRAGVLSTAREGPAFNSHTTFNVKVTVQSYFDMRFDSITRDVLSIFVDKEFQAASVFFTPSSKVTPVITSFKSGDPFNER
jgi:hypothetical protein